MFADSVLVFRGVLQFLLSAAAGSSWMPFRCCDYSHSNLIKRKEIQHGLAQFSSDGEDSVPLWIQYM
jgi:hypothetical protein